MKALSKSDKIKTFIEPKMTDIVTFLDNNKKMDFYTGLNIHLLYCYLEMIGSPTALTTSGQSSRHFGPLLKNREDAGAFSLFGICDNF